MTRDELDQKIIEKKIAELKLADRSALLCQFPDGYTIPQQIGDLSAKLLKLNLISKATRLPPGVKLPLSEFYYQLTHFGRLVKKRLGG